MSPPGSRPCPKCGHVAQIEAAECARCGVIFARLSRSDAVEDDPGLWMVLGRRRRLVMDQHVRRWWEVLFGIEQTNEYTLYGEDGRPVAFVSELEGGFWRLLARLLLGARRPMDVVVSALSREVVLQLSRRFSFFFSEMIVENGQGRRLGVLRRRFSLIYRHYDLIDAKGRTFAMVRSPFWRLWTFPILDHTGRERGQVAKRWSGLLQEYFTDADKFMIDMGDHDWTLEQRGLILAAAVLIDFDFFENNHQG